MIENFKFTLWDIYVFFLTGFVVSFTAIIFCLISDPSILPTHFNEIEKISSGQLFLFCPLLFVSIGLLLEPISNISFKIIDKCFDGVRSLSKCIEFKKCYFVSQFFKILNHEIGFDPMNYSKKMENEIKQNHLGALSGKIENPYQFCKVYIQDKDLSKEFMVFLARFGFYRNISFTFLALAAVSFFHFQNSMGVVFAIAMSCLYKFRSNQFYSYLAPTVFTTYFIHKALDQKEKGENQNPE